MAGTGIGTFSDRLRDAVRGGGPFDEDPRIQGFGSGLYTDPNGAAVNGSPAEQLARLRHSEDLVKLGLAGNLQDYTFTDSTGQVVKGSQIDYNGQPAGYAADPSETITYVDAHDNETLFDALQYKLPTGTSMADRVRMNTAGPGNHRARRRARRSGMPATTSCGRSRWTGTPSTPATGSTGSTGRTSDTTWGSGLPPAPDNQAKWDFQRPLLSDPALAPSSADIRAAHAAADRLLAIRAASPLLRLGSAALIQQRVSFPNSGPARRRESS